MPDLTDERVDFNLDFLRQTVTEHSVAGPRIWDRTIAAVIAKAKREERDGVMAWLYTLAANFTDPQASSALAYAAEMLAHKEPTR